MFGTFNKVAPGFKQDSGLGIQDSKVYVGFVKNNVDVQKMGRLEVFIPELGTNSEDPAQWYIANYASPFAGATNHMDLVKGSKDEAGSQSSYGFWMIPPDLNNQVLVLFINGEPTKCVWFACLFQQNMNHMVPGTASNFSFTDSDKVALEPVVEYNKADESINSDSPIRPRFSPLADAITNEGLNTDFERGPASSSARRESPSKVFGFNTPRSNAIYIDDDPDNEFIRMRTRSGTQILVHETNGYVYINSSSGNSWIEVSDDGIDMYSAGSLSMRTEQDFNIRADRNINLDAGNSVNITAGTTINEYAGSALNQKSGGNINQETGTHNTKARVINRDGYTKDNCGSAPSVAKPTTIARADVPSGIINTTNSRMPTHEPFALHPKSKNLRAPYGDVPSDAMSASGGEGGAMGNGGSPSKSVETTNAPPTKIQKTGDGREKTVPMDADSKSKLVSGGNKNASERVIAAIKRASDMTGVDYGYMMAMAEKESSFNPNAKAKTSSATGLFQFTDTTWAGMQKNYPQYNFKDRYSPEENALAAALLTKENSNSLQKKGISNPSPSDLYLAHFAGPVSAAKLIKAPNDADASSIVGSRAADANKPTFAPNGVKQTVGQVTSKFSNFITPRAVAYSDFGKTTPAA